jgi:uncharacterized protein YndB with AHSA1/START domain
MVRVNATRRLLIMTDAITREIIVRAPLARVWRAVADHREFGRWFRVDLDGPFVEGQRVEGRMTYPGAEGLPFSALVTAVRPEALLAFEWPAYVEDEGVLEDEPWTLVEFRLIPEGEGTRVTITESGFERLPVRVRDRIRRENEGGWEAQAQNLVQHVTARAA